MILIAETQLSPLHAPVVNAVGSNAKIEPVTLNSVFVVLGDLPVVGFAVSSIIQASIETKILTVLCFPAIRVLLQKS